jgi:hypothetical protein
MKKTTKKKDSALTDQVRVVMTREKREEYEKLAAEQSVGLTGLFDLGFEAVKLLLGKSVQPPAPGKAHYTPPGEEPAPVPPAEKTKRKYPMIRIALRRPPSIHARAAEQLFEQAAPRSAAYAELKGLAKQYAEGAGKLQALCDNWHEMYKAQAEERRLAEAEARDLRATLSDVEGIVQRYAHEPERDREPILWELMTVLAGQRSSGPAAEVPHAN